MAAKRRANVSDYSDDSVCSDDDYCPETPPMKRFRAISTRHGRTVLKSSSLNNSSGDENFQGRERKVKCNSKNAIMARENRMKKKMYVDGLEKQISTLKDENRRMKVTLSTQIGYVKELETEVAYLKSVLANSKEIGALIGNICNGTSLQIKSSIREQTPADPPQRRRPPIAKKTAWSFDTQPEEVSIPTPSTSISSLSPPYQQHSPDSPLNIDIDSYFSDDNDMLPLYGDVQLSPVISCDDLEDSLREPAEAAMQEHSYSSKMPDLQTIDHPHGVCIHISNRRLSLEFCSKCNEKAIANWDEVTP